MIPGVRTKAFRWVLAGGLIAVAVASAQTPTVRENPFKEVPAPLPTPALLPVLPAVPATPPVQFYPSPMPPAPATKPVTPPIVDPQVRPVQQLLPPISPTSRPPESIPDVPSAAVRTGISSTPTPVTANVPHPPTPMVRIQVLAPSHVAPGKPLTYQIVITNASTASAHRVAVRMPIPDGIAAVNKVEPAPEGWAAQPPKLPAAIAGVKELTWTFKTLAPSESRKVEIEFSPIAGTKDVSARAYVFFEHGEQVVTNIEKPKLGIKKTATPQAAQGEAVTVRVEVKNTSAVPIPKVRLVETASVGFEYRGDADSERTEKPNQRVWQLGTLAPGQSKIVTYQLVGKQGGDLATTSNAASEDAAVASETAESTTKILVPALQLGFAGPTEPVPARAPATYEATVRNNGTLALTDVRVTIPVPADCEVKSMTNRGQRTKDAVIWVIPQLRAGEAESFRMKVEANTSGKRSLRATVRDGKGLVEDGKDLTTIFQGRADLHWKPDVSPPILQVGKTGSVSIVVRNEGGETAKAVRIRVTLPKEVRVSSTNPNKATQAEDEVLFAPLPILPGKSETFTVNFEAKQAGRAFFRMRLEEPETFGEKALIKEQPIEITSSR